MPCFLCKDNIWYTYTNSEDAYRRAHSFPFADYFFNLAHPVLNFQTDIYQQEYRWEKFEFFVRVVQYGDIAAAHTFLKKLRYVGVLT